jgi:hypothetical protein
MKNNMMILNSALIAFLTLGVATASAQSTETNGWLEGTVVDTKGKPVWVIAYAIPGFNVKAIPSSGNPTESEPKPDMGGLFGMKNLRPGVYEVWVPATKNADGTFRAQRIHGVVVKPGVRTMLKIVVTPGDQLQEIARPVSTEEALIVAQEILRLARKEEQLQQQVDALQKDVTSQRK